MLENNNYQLRRQSIYYQYSSYFQQSNSRQLARFTGRAQNDQQNHCMAVRRYRGDMQQFYQYFSQYRSYCSKLVRDSTPVTISAILVAATLSIQHPPMSYAQPESELPPAFRTYQPNCTQKYYTYKVIATYDHDPQAFTQGLLAEKETKIIDGVEEKVTVLWESTGMYGRSEIRKVDLKTGTVLQRTRLHKSYFGEGVTEYKGALYQLTYESQKGFVYDKKTMLQTRQFNTGLSDGWGITNDGSELLVTDGSPVLSFLNPNTMTVTKQVTIRDGERPVKWVNDLEYINNKIWANIWYRECLARIDPASGQVEAWVDLRGIFQMAADGASMMDQYYMDVMNGIAYDLSSNKLYITGKQWPKLFELELIEIEQPSDQVIRGIKEYCVPSNPNNKYEWW